MIYMIMKSIYKNSNLIIYFIGIFVSGIGTKLTTIALSDKVMKLTGNDFNVSLVFMLQSIPILIFGMLAGYAFAGILVNFTGDNIAFILDGLSFIFIAIVSIFLKISKVDSTVNSDNEINFKKDTIDGWNFIRNNTNVKYMFFIDVIITFIISMQTPLTYIFVKKYLGGSTLMAQRTGFLFAFAGIGTIFGGVILARYKNRNKLMLLSISLVFDSMLVIAFSLNRYFPITLLLFGGMGVVGAFNGGILQTVIQEKTPENLLGRVSGCINSIVQPIGVISILIGSICSNFIEVKWVFIIGALLELVTGVYFYNVL